jgi:hypothetical protein
LLPADSAVLKDVLTIHWTKRSTTVYLPVFPMKRLTKAYLLVFQKKRLMKAYLPVFLKKHSKKVCLQDGLNLTKSLKVLQ